MSLVVTSALAGLFALIMVPLSVQVSLRRVALGDAAGGDELLRRRIRAHGNFIEYAPLAVICVGLIEFGDAPQSLVLGLAGAFLISRVVHAAGMLYTSTPPLRAGAMLLQHAAFLVAGSWLLYRVLG